MSMTTPIVDFVQNYAKSGTSRLHMPGHKGQALLGFEGLDITEIRGADELYEADGIIYEQIKFCDPWAYERMLGSHILNDDYGYPVLSVDRPYNIASSGQMRTRVQAFVESMEIKKIQGGKQ